MSQWLCRNRKELPKALCSCFSATLFFFLSVGSFKASFPSLDNPAPECRTATSVLTKGTFKFLRESKREQRLFFSYIVSKPLPEPGTAHSALVASSKCSGQTNTSFLITLI